MPFAAAAAVASSSSRSPAAAHLFASAAAPGLVGCQQHVRVKSRTAARSERLGRREFVGGEVRRTYAPSSAFSAVPAGPSFSSVSVVSASAAASTATTLRFAFADGTMVSFPWTYESARKLGDEVNGVLISFKNKKEELAAKPSARTRYEQMEYRAEDGAVKLAVDCNPNVHADALQAKVYVVVEAAGLRVAAEGLLSDFIEDLKAFLAASAPAPAP
eukprot:tig00021244_g19589.t1